MEQAFPALPHPKQGTGFKPELRAAESGMVEDI
jgi:hypothetical protein